MKKALVVLVLALLPITSFAAINFQKEGNGAILTTAKNAYMAGSSVKVPAEIQGDVFVAGGSVLASEVLNQDLVAAGGNVFITSRVAGDVRVAGGNINISGLVAGELVAVGGQVEISPSCFVEGDFIIAAGMANIDGSMNGSGKIFGDKVSISGILSKDITIKANSLVIDKTAVINGNIDYKGSEEAVVKDGAKINGKITFTKVEMPKVAKPANFAGMATAVFTIFWFFKLLAMIVLSLVLFFLMKRNLPKILGETMSNFWKEVLRGFAIMVLTPVAAVILFATMIGLPIGILAMASYGLLLILSGAFSGILTAKILKHWLARKSEKPVGWLMVVCGVIVLQLVILIPVVGWIAKMFVFWASLGTIAGLIYRKMKTLGD